MRLFVSEKTANVRYKHVLVSKKTLANTYIPKRHKKQTFDRLTLISPLMTETRLAKTMKALMLHVTSTFPDVHLLRIKIR